MRKLMLSMAVGLIASSVAWACPNCAQAIGNDPGSNAPLAFQYSIYFMLAMPFLLTGGFGLYCYRLVKGAAGQADAIPTDSPDQTLDG